MHIRRWNIILALADTWIYVNTRNLKILGFVVLYLQSIGVVFHVHTASPNHLLQPSWIRHFMRSL